MYSSLLLPRSPSPYEQGGGEVGRQIEARGATCPSPVKEEHMVRWRPVRVPSHVGTCGNEKANTLAEHVRVGQFRITVEPRRAEGAPGQGV